MKLLFFGDCMFGRNGNKFIVNPFINVEHMIKDSSHIFFNLETTISEKPLPAEYKQPKTFTYQSTGEQVKVLRKIGKKKPIFVSIANNHSLVIHKGKKLNYVCQINHGDFGGNCVCK